MLKFSLNNYFMRHLQVMLYSLGQLWRQPAASSMTILVIGIALALPAGLYVLLKNVDQVSSQWDGASQISLFLHHQTSDTRGMQLAEQLKTWPDINTVSYQSAQQSLEEFRHLSGLEDVLDNLPSNPLPPVIFVQPKVSENEAELMQDLLQRLQQLQDVELAQIDMAWLQRLHSLNETGERGIRILAILLSLSVMLVVGNTIRLAILNRQAEIRIIKLVGGTNAFIRRPFLYTGFWYGLLGGIIAWLTLLAALLTLSGPVDHLAELYGSQFTLDWLAGQLFLALPLFGMLLGVLGSWLAVGRHLNDIEPT